MAALQKHPEFPPSIFISEEAFPKLQFLGKQPWIYGKNGLWTGFSYITPLCKNQP
jgi:hypothetical protein